MRVIEQKSQFGASNWLSLLPLSLFEYILLNKRKHTDAISLRYNRDVKGLAYNCPYDLSKICNEVETEPVLQPETSEHLPVNAVQCDEARLHFRAGGFWRKFSYYLVQWLHVLFHIFISSKEVC